MRSRSALAAGLIVVTLADGAAAIAANHARRSRIIDKSYIVALLV